MSQREGNNSSESESDSEPGFPQKAVNFVKTFQYERRKCYSHASSSKQKYDTEDQLAEMTWEEFRESPDASKIDYNALMKYRERQRLSRLGEQQAYRLSMCKLF